MAIVLAAAADQATYSVHLQFTGQDPTKDYIVWRAVVDGHGVIGPYVTIHTGKISSAGIDDPVAPFNENLSYVVTDNKAGINQGTIPANTLASATTMLSFSGQGPQKPVIPTYAGDFPILRAPMAPALGWFKIPVLSYTGDFMLRGQVHEIIGSASPVVSADVMQLKSGTLQLATSSKPERAQMVELFRNPAVVLHLRAPCVDGAADDLFFVPLEVTEEIPQTDRPDFRVWTIQFQQVNRPWQYILPAGTTRSTWGELTLSGRTWAKVKADYATWLELRFSIAAAGRTTSHGTAYEGSV